MPIPGESRRYCDDVMYSVCNSVMCIYSSSILAILIIMMLSCIHCDIHEVVLMQYECYCDTIDNNTKVITSSHRRSCCHIDCHGVHIPIHIGCSYCDTMHAGDVGTTVHDSAPCISETRQAIPLDCLEAPERSRSSRCVTTTTGVMEFEREAGAHHRRCQEYSGDAVGMDTHRLVHS